MTQLFSNNARSTLAADITNVATSLTVAAGHGARFAAPAAGEYELATLFNGPVLNPGDAYEIVKITGRSTDSLTIARAQEGTTALAWTAGAIISGRITSGTLQKLIQNNPTTPNSIVVGKNTFDGVSPAVVARSTAYAAGDVAYRAASGGHLLYCTVAGTTAASEPTWNNTQYQSTVDGSATWIYLGVVFANEMQYNGLFNTDQFPGRALRQSWAFGLESQALVSSCAFGNSAKAIHESSAFGLGAYATYSSAAFSYASYAIKPHSCAYGHDSYANAPGSMAFGKSAYVGDVGGDAAIYATAWGYLCKNEIAQSFAKVGASIIRKSSAIIAGYEIAFGSGDRVIITSSVIDLKILADNVVAITIPTGARFFVDEIGLIITAASGVTGQPSISSGITGNTVALLASTATVGAALHDRDTFAPLSKNGQASLTASVKAAAAATTLSGRFYWEGKFVESE